MTIRILQLTDLHLFEDRQARLKGVPTFETFTDILQLVHAQPGEFDWVIITGDMTHDERLETYQLLRETLGSLMSRCKIIPGNHENREYIREVFPDVVPAGPGPLTFSFQVEGWRLIGLDSHVPGEVPGRIERSQLQWLQAELEKDAEVPTLLFMHHPPFKVGATWLDKIRLQEPEELLEIIQAAPQIRSVVTGHVHHVFEGSLGKTRLMTSPSTGVQFVPQVELPKYADTPPGFRVLTLEDGDFTTEVFRLGELKYPPINDAD